MKQAIVLIIALATPLFAQESAAWKVMPTISVTTAFSMEGSRHHHAIRPLWYPTELTSPFLENEGFSSTGVLFTARFLNADMEPLAVTLSAGANWYHHRNEPMMPQMLAYGGPPFPSDSTRPPFPVGGAMYGGFYDRDGGSLVGFPMSLGVQFLFPYEKIDKLMFFAGVEGNMAFMSQRVLSGRQVEWGGSLVGGIAVKKIEAGIRFSRFAQRNSIGLQLGIRFNHISLE